MKKKRIRNIPLHVMLSEKELEQIQERVIEAGMNNRSAFIRRMAMKDYVINVDTSFVFRFFILPNFGPTWPEVWWQYMERVS